MKKAALFLFPILAFCFACGNQNKKNGNISDYNEYVEYMEDNEPEAPLANEEDELNADLVDKGINQPNMDKKSAFFSDVFRQKGLKTHEFKDAHTGLIVNSAEYPADWQVISKPSYTIDQKLPMFLVQIQGPHHLKTFNTPLTVYVSYQNPQTYQFMAQYGIPSVMQRPMISNQQIIETEVKERMEKSGFHFNGIMQMPKTVDYLHRKFKEGGSDVNSEITFSIWENNEGQKAMAMVTKAFMQQPLSFIDVMTLWLYTIDYTFVDLSYFDETINHLENALVNTKENPQWQQYYQQLIQQRALIAQQQCEQNRRSKEAAFNAHQQKMRGIWAAQDANHAAFMNRNFGSGSSNSQQQVINMINEQETVYNPLTGQNYQVDAGSAEYWMDSNGNYIKNNDLFYTPNGDINLNNREWVKVNSGF
ncbi:MAG: hypothetical protein R2757_05945 [Draconibacterium sp.]